MVRNVKGIPSFLGLHPRQSHGSFHYSGDWREVSVKIDDGNLHLPPNEVLLRSKASTNEHDQLQARSGPSMGHEICWCLEDVLVSTSIVTFWQNSRRVRTTTQSRLMYPPASLLRKDDNEEDDIDEDIPEEYVLNKCSHSSTIYLWFLPDIKVMVEARNSHVQDGESDGDANLLSSELMHEVIISTNDKPMILSQIADLFGTDCYSLSVFSVEGRAYEKFV